MKAGTPHDCKDNFLSNWLTENVEVVALLKSSSELKSN